MNRGFAQFISYLIHPGLVPLVGCILIMMLSPHYISRPVFLTVLAYVFLGTYFFPLLMAFFLKKLGLLKSLHMANASERKLPFLTAGLFYFITAQSLRTFPAPFILSEYLFAGVIILGIALMLLGLTKLSIHMAGMGALLALALYLSFSYNYEMLFLIALITLLSGLLGTARLVLKAHTPVEVYLGFFLGFLASLSTFMLF